MTSFEECVFYLGDVGALIFFAHSALQPASNTKKLGWALQLQEAIVYQPSEYRQPRVSFFHQTNLPPDPKITKQQVSKWKIGNPFLLDIPVATGAGWVFRLLNVPVGGISGVGDKWKGSAIFVVEMNTDTFLCRYVDGAFNVTVESLLKIIHEADDRVSRMYRKRTDSALEKQVWLPRDFSDEELETCSISFGEVKEVNVDPPRVRVNSRNCGSIFAVGQYLEQEGKKEGNEVIPPKPPIKKLKNWMGHLYESGIPEYTINVKVPEFHKKTSDGDQGADANRHYMIECGVQLAESIDRILQGMGVLYCEEKDVGKKKKKLSDRESKLKKRRVENCGDMGYSACISLM